MDNNSNNNVSGIPNVSDIKFDDTPAESFDNLYGGTASQPVSNVNMSQGPSMIPNPSMAPNMNQAPSMQPNPGMTPNMNQAPSMQSNPGMAPNMNQAPSMQPNPGMTPNMNQAPSMQPNPGMTSNMNQAPSMQSNPGMTPNMNQAPSMQPNPGMAPNMDQAPSMQPNPGTIIQPQVENLSSMDIDAEKMQSIEEQLSKTSQYNPADFQQEQITIPTDDQYEKNKSGLAFVIVLFIILALVIALLPQITKFIK